MYRTGEGLVIILIGLFTTWGASLIPAPPEGETWAGLLPMGIAICLTLSGALMFWISFRSAPVIKKESDASPKALYFSVKVGGLVTLAVFYYQFILNFGYELSTAFIGPMVLYLFGIRNIKGLALSVVLFPLIFHILFFKLLGVFPPLGEIVDLMDYFRG